MSLKQVGIDYCCTFCEEKGWYQNVMHVCVCMCVYAQRNMKEMEIFRTFYIFHSNV